jgi:hypothetical protein
MFASICCVVCVIVPGLKLPHIVGETLIRTTPTFHALVIQSLRKTGIDLVSNESENWGERISSCHLVHLEILYLFSH